MTQILCPVDFSSTSVNAANYAARFVESRGGGTLELLHCINIQRRAGMFLRIDEILKEQAEKDIIQLKESILSIATEVEIITKIVIYDPKEYLVSYIKRHEFDFVFIGSRGLSAVKELTIGSVTDYLMNRVNSALIVVPDDLTFAGVSRIVLGVDDKPIPSSEVVQPLVDLVQGFNARLFLVHISESGDHVMEYDPMLDDYLAKTNYTYERLALVDSVSKTLYKYCDEVGANMLCMLHRKKNWFSRLLIKSSTKAGLFDIRLPILILPMP